MSARSVGSRATVGPEYARGVELTPLEKAALDMLVSRDEPGYGALRRQAKNCHAVSREMTGAGFFTKLRVKVDCPEAPGAVGNPLGQGHAFAAEPFAELEGLDGGAGFVLWLEDGVIDMLEGFSYLTGWPDPIGGFDLRMAPINRQP